MMSVSSCHPDPPPRSTVARVLLLYGGGASPPRLRRRGCTVLVGTAAHGAWEVQPRRRSPPAHDSGLGNGGQRPPSSASGGVYEGQIDDSGLGSRPHGLRFGLTVFLLLKIDFLYRLT
jgi:hypothetical protein